MIKIEIDTSNAAFKDNDGRPEIARILRELATRIEDYDNPSLLKDLNGNPCGHFFGVMKHNDRNKSEHK